MPEPTLSSPKAPTPGPALVRPARGLRQITVLGMHRSGTSATAGALCAAGAWAGDEADLMPATQFNAKGYFERHDTAATLDSVLDELGGSWHAPPSEALNRLGLEPHRDRLRRMFDAIGAATPEGRVALVKDPRLSLFASELPTVLGSTDGIVVCVRHPLAVARSLRRSEGVALTRGLALWEHYNATICNGLSGRPVRVRAFGLEQEEQTTFDAFVDDVLRVFKAPVPEADRGGSHWSAELFRESADAEDELQWLTAAQISLWQALAEAARSTQPTALESVAVSAVAMQVLEQEREAVRLSARLAQAQERAELVPELSARATDAEQRGAGLAAELDAARADNGAVREHLEAADAELRALRERLADAAAEAAEQEVSRAVVDAQLDQVRRDLRVTAEGLLEARAQTSAHEALRADLQHQWEATAAQVAELRDSLDQAHHELAAERERLGQNSDEQLALSASLVLAQEELAAVRQHRDAVVAEHLQVMSSRSWRVGRALTAPGRVLRRRSTEPTEG